MSAIVLWSAKHRHHSVPQSPLKPFLQSRFQTYPPHMLLCHTLPCWACSFSVLYACIFCMLFSLTGAALLRMIPMRATCHKQDWTPWGRSHYVLPILLPAMASSGDTYARCSFFCLADTGRWFHKYTWAWISTKGSAMHWPSNVGCWLKVHFNTYIYVQMIFAYILTSIFKVYFTI